MSETRAIRATIQRAGSSKGIFLLENDLPEDPVLREKVILAIFGSPDKRQIDGLGGADPLTSKVAIVGPSKQEGVDVDYTFGQVAFDQAKVHTHAICGNISSGVGPFAIDHGLVKAEEPITTVKIFNTNTNKVLTAEVPVKEGRAAVEGDYSIAGVPGTGAKVTLDFSQTVGALTGKLLPTGNVKDTIELSENERITVSIVDAATCQVFVRAEDLGLKGTESPKEVDSQPELLRKLELIRCIAATKAGLAESPEKCAVESRNTPHIVFFSEAKDYENYLTQEKISEESIDLVARGMFMQIMHKTYAGTGSICTSVAAAIPGTNIHEAVKKEIMTKKLVRIGHPAGIIPVEVEVQQEVKNFILKKAAIGRTSRRIMDGNVYIRNSLFQ
ncbi:methylitaconate delta2-delta3-isomerase [Bacillus oleivorans]|uniref:Methylitaconate delta2-delta3-isomerase n=1 Tax=Bacillus oleivorans TaxID=1448271 RepID=A0A285D6R5_9BACI|nr:PrpF domain-containing protein [Bacillus oleivorans]SNX75507.1 methylitaconate delta2-delta3-isomerase [Bacillus oleivorans]